MKGSDKAYWLADKIPAYGDYAREAAEVLKRQADEIGRLTSKVAFAELERKSLRTAIAAMANISYSDREQVKQMRVEVENSRKRIAYLMDAAKDALDVFDRYENEPYCMAHLRAVVMSEGGE